MKYAVFLNGEYPDMKSYMPLLEDRIIYCADGGANKAYELGIIPFCIVGDLDSVNDEVIKHYKKLNVKIYKYDSNKDYTDFEIVLMHICNIKNVDLLNRFKLEKDIDFYQNKDVLVFGATGNRIDMSICNLSVLSHNKNMKYISHTDDLIYYIDKETTITNMKGKRFGIISYTNLEKLSLNGFMYNLDKKDIKHNRALVSNEITEDIAKVHFEKGQALIVITLNKGNGIKEDN